MDRRLAVEQRVQSRVAGALVVEPWGAEQFVFGSDEPRWRDIVGHQLPPEQRVGVDARVLGNPLQDRGRGVDAPDRVDVPLWVQRDALAVLGEVNRQLGHAQYRLGDVDQHTADTAVRTIGEPTRESEVAIEPRVEPRTAVGFERNRCQPG